MDKMLDSFSKVASLIIEKVPYMLWALLILVVGWLVALIISKALAAALRKISLNKKFADMAKEDTSIKHVKMEQWISKGVYYLLLLVVLVFFFHALQFGDASEPFKKLLNQVFEYLPQIISAGLLVLVAWAIASILRTVIVVVLGRLNLDVRIAGKLESKTEKPVPVTKTIAGAVYWLVFLIFVPLVLEALGLKKGLLEPVSVMLQKVLAFLPQLIGAIIILLVGWFIARIVQKIVVNFLSSAKADQLGEQIGLKSADQKHSLSKTVGTIVYILILIPVLVAALQQLAIEAISTPLSEMLSNVAQSAPNIFYAAVIILVACIIGRVVAELIKNLLTGVGFDSVPVKLGIGKKTASGELTPSEAVGKLALVGIVFFAIIEACVRLGFNTLANLGTKFMLFAGDVILGLVIFSMGLFLANLAVTLIKGKIGHSDLVAFLVRICILVFAGAMALNRMGFANDIINMAFGLLLGAVAVAIAIAFGVGGREFAARKLQDWETSLKEKK